MNRNMALSKLRRAYSEARHNGDGSFGLYLGAGVNLPSTRREAQRASVNTYTWIQLLEEMHARVSEMCRRQGARDQQILLPAFDVLREKCSGHLGGWPRLASSITRPLRDELACKDLIDEVLYEKFSRADQYARLPKSFLEQAPTLRAAICFSAAIHRVDRGKVKGSWGFHPNPAIGCVITPNYDFFFGAGWTRYERFREKWKVVIPFDSEEAIGNINKSERTPIYYMHGYIPYKYFAFMRRSDIMNASQLGERLLFPRDAVAKHVRDVLSPQRVTSLTRLCRRDTSESGRRELRRMLTEEFNRVIGSSCCLCNNKAVKLRREWLQASKDRMREKASYARGVMLLNRLLLQEGFPNEIKPLSSKLVLTTKDYDRAYGTPDAFATRVLRNAIEQHRMIFLGTSFTDRPLCDMLKAYKRRLCTDERRHFVISPEDQSMNHDRADELGLHWVKVRSYARIPRVLKEVYCHNLTIDPNLKTLIHEGMVGKIRGPEDYWRVLEYGPRQKRRETERPED